MAQIDIERTPEKKSPWGWILASLLVLVVAAAAFLFLSDAGREMTGQGGDEMEPDTAGMTAPPATEPPPSGGVEPR